VTRVALVTDRRTGEMYADGPLLIRAFADLDIDATIVPWGSGPDWSSFDAVLVRHTWDYIFDRHRFLEWAAGVDAVTRIANSADVLRWNTDKRYLRDLEAAGVDTVPTVWIEPGQRVPSVEWRDFVVKPSVSAGARLSARYQGDADIAEHVRRIHDDGMTAMVQPYLSSVEDHGETGTYVFGGRVSHAISKGPVLRRGHPVSDELDAASRQSVAPAPIDPELAAFALQVLAAAPPVLYARVDTAPGGDGHPMLLELEVTEPYLFLEHAPRGAVNFAGAVAAWLGVAR
jgi:glutathione synthase/RimK-type ligase-like ATP-grasp enzyme